MTNQVTNAPVDLIETKSVQIKNGKRAGQTSTIYYLIVGGQKFQYGWSQPPVVAGQVVSFQFNVGNYGAEIDPNTVIIGPNGTAPASVPPVPGNTGGGGAGANRTYSKGGGRAAKPFPIPLLHGDRSIIRQNSATRATDIVVAMIASGALTPATPADAAQAALALAPYFERYASGDNEREAAEQAAQAPVAGVGAPVVNATGHHPTPVGQVASTPPWVGAPQVAQ